MNAHGPKSIVSPAIDMLSVFITPWMKPTSSQSGDQARLPRDDGIEQRAGTASAPRLAG